MIYRNVMIGRALRWGVLWLMLLCLPVVISACSGSGVRVSPQKAASEIKFDQDIALRLVEVLSPYLIEDLHGTPVSVAPQPNGGLFILSREPSQIIQLDSLRRPLRTEIPAREKLTLSLVEPRVIRLGMGLAILVADAYGQVYAYDYQLRLVEAIEPSADATQFPSNAPKGLAISPYGETYIVDGDNDIIFEYDPGGKFVGVLGEARQSVLRLTRPTGIDVCDDGRLLVCDTGMRRVLLISEVGDVLEAYENADLWEPVSVVITPDQKALFIGDRRTGELWLFSLDGDLQKSWAGSELTGKGIKSITDLQIMGDILFLVDMVGEQVCLFKISQTQ